MKEIKLANKQEIEFFLEGHRLWKYENGVLIKEFIGSNFSSAIGLINSIGLVAESMNHFPDILLYGWNKVRVSVSSYDLGGITDTDIRFSVKLDELIF